MQDRIPLMTSYLHRQEPKSQIRRNKAGGSKSEQPPSTRSVAHHVSSKAKRNDGQSSTACERSPTARISQLNCTHLTAVREMMDNRPLRVRSWGGEQTVIQPMTINQEAGQPICPHLTAVRRETISKMILQLKNSPLRVRDP